MAAENMSVRIVADTTAFEAALARASEASRTMAASLRRTGRQVARVFDTRGDRHIESIIRDSVRRRLSVDDTARHLMVASDIAQILDRRRLDHNALDAQIRDGLQGWGQDGAA